MGPFLGVQFPWVSQLLVSGAALQLGGPRRSRSRWVPRPVPCRSAVPEPVPVPGVVGGAGGAGGSGGAGRASAPAPRSPLQVTLLGGSADARRAEVGRRRPRRPPPAEIRDRARVAMLRPTYRTGRRTGSGRIRIPAWRPPSRSARCVGAGTGGVRTWSGHPKDPSGEGGAPVAHKNPGCGPPFRYQKRLPEGVRSPRFYKLLRAA